LIRFMTRTANSAEISIVSGQISEVVISHCFQGAGHFCAGEGA
jgi:hypothetical protein